MLYVSHHSAAKLFTKQHCKDMKIHKYGQEICKKKCVKKYYQPFSLIVK